MEKTLETLQKLQELQDLQVKAFTNGIESFEIGARHFDDGPGFTVTVFLKGDDTDEDYGRFEFWDLDDSVKTFRTLNNLKSFINVLD